MKKLIAYIAVLGLGAGIGMYVGSDFQYKVTREDGKPFLYNRKTSEKQPITENFQLGSLEYRIEGIKAEIAKIKEFERVVKDGSSD